MTEGQLLGEVTALAEQLGLLWHHCGRSERCQGSIGFPDLILVGRRVMFAELKSDTGRTSAGQDEWAYWLSRPSHYRLWRPSDLTSGAIEQAMRGLL